MARTNLPLSTFTNGIDLNDAGTAIDAANGMNINLGASTIPVRGRSDYLLIYATNTAAATKTITIRKGDNTNYLNVPAFEAGKGDVVTGNLNATTGNAFICALEVARFEQSGAAGADQPAGSVNVDFAAGTTGLIYALLIPRAF